MPKSKRDKEITLTKVKRKGKEMKSKLIDDIRQSVDTYPNIFAFAFDNMRNSNMAIIRNHFKADGRFYFGKNKLMALALGRVAEEEYKEKLHQVSSHLTGFCGLLFTNQSIDEVLRYLEKFRHTDYARSGNVATETVELDAGPLHQFPFNLEPQLRKLGLPTKLDKGIITLTTDYAVCQVGETLNPEQAKILKFLDYKMAEFRLRPLCVWSRDVDDANSTPIFKKLVKKSQENSKLKKKKQKRISKDQETMDTDVS